MENVEIAAAVVGITEVVKKIGLPAKYCPAFAIALGAILALLAEITYGNSPIGIMGFVSAYFWAIIRGAIIGTTATGLYAVGGGVVDKVRNNKPQTTPKVNPANISNEHPQLETH